jgi:hypothetical protein
VNDRNACDDPRLDLDPDRLRGCLDREPFRIGHRLSGHPLFAMDRLLELCRALPEHCVEYNAGDVAVGQDPSLTPRTGLSAEETVRRIAESKSWLVLKYVERDLAYRDLLYDCLDEIRAVSEAVSPGMDQREGFIFLSSPRSITPFHMDPELNFLLQIAGSKKMRIFDNHDRSIVGEAELERFHREHPHRNLPYREEFAARERVFELGPGDGVHVPVTTPHWVEVGDEVSLSFSITFRSDVSERRAALYALNAALRARGLRPRPPGKSRASDELKYFLYRAGRRLGLVGG